MEYRTLGGSGTAVSHLALGTASFGTTTDRDGAFAQLDTFVSAGGTLVHTADVHSHGAAEEFLGAWLANRPTGVTERIVLATGGRFPTSDEPNGAGLSRRHLTRALDASLRRLGVGTVDLYQLHAWDPWTPVEETLATLDSFVRAGKVHQVGLSDFTGWQVQKTVDVAAAGGFPPPVTVQPQYNLLTREIEWEIVPAARENRLGLLARSPLCGGWLSGRYTRTNPPNGAVRYDGHARTWAVVDAAQTIVDRRGATMAQVALAWVAARPAVSSVVLGARSAEQLKEALESAHLELDAGELRALDEASDPEPAHYPYGATATARRSRTLHGGT